MALETLIYPGSSSFFPGQTPFGIYDDDYNFQGEAPKVALWCARRLGYPIQNIELIDENFYACFEESVSEYGAQVNQFNIRNNLDSLKGKSKATNLTSKLVQGSNLPNLIAISDAYGTLAGVGGNTDIKKGFIELVPGQQEYNLDTLWAAVSESGKRIEIVKVFQEPTPAINRFFDPYSVSGQGTLNLIDEFGFGSFSPAAQFILMPMYEDMLRIQAIEFNDQVRRSAYTFNLVNNVLEIFPIPGSSTYNPTLLWFEYVITDERIEASMIHKPNVISSYANINYDNMTYASINSVGKQWIWKYTLALAKELLGGIREKYASIPIPEGEISLDGASLRAEAQNDKDRLYEQLRQDLEELSRPKQMEYKAQEAEQVQKMLKNIPLPFYIG